MARARDGREAVFIHASMRDAGPWESKWSTGVSVRQLTSSAPDISAAASGDIGNPSHTSRTWAVLSSNVKRRSAQKVRAFM
jgi:hypothetical protein